MSLEPAKIPLTALTQKNKPAEDLLRHALKSDLRSGDQPTVQLPGLESTLNPRRVPAAERILFCQLPAGTAPDPGKADTKAEPTISPREKAEEIVKDMRAQMSETRKGVNRYFSHNPNIGDHTLEAHEFFGSKGKAGDLRLYKELMGRIERQEKGLEKVLEMIEAGPEKYSREVSQYKVGDKLKSLATELKAVDRSVLGLTKAGTRAANAKAPDFVPKAVDPETTAETAKGKLTEVMLAQTTEFTARLNEKATLELRQTLPERYLDSQAVRSEKQKDPNIPTTWEYTVGGGATTSVSLTLKHDKDAGWQWAQKVSGKEPEWKSMADRLPVDAKRPWLGEANEFLAAFEKRHGEIQALDLDGLRKYAQKDLSELESRSIEYLRPSLAKRYLNSVGSYVPAKDGNQESWLVQTENGRLQFRFDPESKALQMRQLPAVGTQPEFPYDYKDVITREYSGIPVITGRPATMKEALVFTERINARRISVQDLKHVEQELRGIEDTARIGSSPDAATRFLVDIASAGRDPKNYRHFNVGEYQFTKGDTGAWMYRKAGAADAVWAEIPEAGIASGTDPKEMRANGASRFLYGLNHERDFYSSVSGEVGKDKREQKSKELGLKLLTETLGAKEDPKERGVYTFKLADRDIALRLESKKDADGTSYQTWMVRDGMSAGDSKAFRSPDLTLYPTFKEEKAQDGSVRILYQTITPVSVKENALLSIFDDLNRAVRAPE